MTTDIDLDTELALFAKALSHPVRIRILRLLARQPADQCRQIVDELPLAQSTVSEHLRVLCAAGLIRANRNRPCVGYCLVPDAMVRCSHLIGDLCAGPTLNGDPS
jgi:ArsR family transcriptional regulator, arsenate/arsenite/antimonite-responsive transcriptional repressor